MSQSTDSTSLLSPPDVETTTANVLAPPPAPDEAQPRKSRRSQGLPPLSDAGLDATPSERLVSLEERLAIQTANTVRVTPARQTRLSITVPLMNDTTTIQHPSEDATPGVTRESADSTIIAAGGTRESPAGSTGIPHTIGVDVDVGRALDSQIDAFLSRTPGYVPYSDHDGARGDAAQAGGRPDDLSNVDWDLFVEGLAGDFPEGATDAIPASVRMLFLAQARAADRALAAFRQELRVGQSRQDDLASELRVHRMQSFKAVRNDTDALKSTVSSVQRDVAVIAALQRKMRRRQRRMRRRWRPY